MLLSTSIADKGLISMDVPIPFGEVDYGDTSGGVKTPMEDRQDPKNS